MPNFEIVRPNIGHAVPPSVADLLRTVGVPRGLIGAEYVVMDTAVILPQAPTSLVAFGKCGLYGRICVDGGSGAVVQAVDSHAEIVQPVNANVDLFSRSVKAVVDRFPFYTY